MIKIPKTFVSDALDVCASIANQVVSNVSHRFVKLYVELLQRSDQVSMEQLSGAVRLIPMLGDNACMAMSKRICLIGQDAQAIMVKSLLDSTVSSHDDVVKTLVLQHPHLIIDASVGHLVRSWFIEALTCEQRTNLMCSLVMKQPMHLKEIRRLLAEVSLAGSWENRVTRLLGDQIDEELRNQIQGTVNILCDVISADVASGNKPDLSILLHMSTVAIDFKPTIHRLSTAASIYILLSTHDDAVRLHNLYSTCPWVKEGIDLWMMIS
jgi:hypothetical protein